MNSKIQIAIIDSGVTCHHPAFSNSNPIIISDGEAVETNSLYGHGTAIYNIIRKVNSIASIINFKLDHVENGICEGGLISILRKIKKEYNFDIINLSLGISICEDLDELYLTCKDLSDAGAVIVSAFDNTGSISYPAAFDNVIGVTSGKSCIRIDDFEYIQDEVVNIGAKGDVQRLAWNNPDYIMLGGNSFACAHTSVQIAKFMIEGIKGFENILNTFKSNAKVQYINPTPSSSKRAKPFLPFEIKKAALFPFNKEMHSLIRFLIDLNFEIVGVYDSKYSANVGSTTNHIMKAEVKNVPIQNIKQIEWNTFDTLILGHLDEMSNLINMQELKKKLINDAIKFGKKIYAFDDISQLFTSESIYCPKVCKEDLPPNRFGKLYRISKPVIGVYGTSSRQGKFTLQLELRQRFLRLGYKVGQIGTEPSSLLYGMDYVYPMGYNNSVYLQYYEAIMYINNLMNMLCKNGTDIIITGSQSGVIPFDTGNLIQYSMPQFSYLLGTHPDLIILCINPFDEIDYIARTKKFIEASVDCRVVAFVVFPMDIKDDWTGIYGQRIILSNKKFMMLQDVLMSKFSIPTYRLGCRVDMDKVVDDVITFFDDPS